jgi:hypothetical protein
MSQRDSSSKIKAQPSGGAAGSQRKGNTRYRMQAAQIAQAEAAKAAAEHARVEEQPQDPQSDSQEMSAQEDNVRGLWKSRVLASYKGKSPKDSHTLLAKVPDGKGTLQVSEHFKASNIQEEMIATVDRMFDTFQNCAYELNKLAMGTELELNWIRPFLSKESTSTWHQSQDCVLVFSGRISTRRWTMVVKGTTEEVLVFILPTDKLIGFALSHKNFKPYFCMVPDAKQLDVRWIVDDHTIQLDQFPLISKALFDALIRFAREEASLDEIFNLRMIGIEPPADTRAEEEIARKKAYQDQFFQDMRSREEFAPSSNPHQDRPQLQTLQQQPQQQQQQQQQHHQPQAQQPQPHTYQAQQPEPPRPEPQYRSQSEYQPEPGTASGGWKPVVNPSSASAVQPDWERMMDPSNRAAPPAPQPQQPIPQQQIHNLQQIQSHQQHVAPPPMPPPMPPAPPMQLPPQQQMVPQAYPMQPHPQMHMPQQQMPPQQQQSYLPQPEPAPAQRPLSPENFHNVLSVLIQCLDKELEAVAKAGADAFAARDLSRADAALKFSGRLTDFRAVARELLSYYHDTGK